MKVAMDARLLLSSGIGRHARQVLGVLAEGGADIALLGDTAALGDIARRYGCELVELLAPPYHPSEQVALARAVPDCDLFYSPHVTTTRLRVRARRRAVTVHDAYHLSPVSGFGAAKRAYARWIYEGALKTADVVIAVSEFTRSELEARFPGLASRVRVLPNCVDGSLFFRDEAPSDNIAGEYALFVGNLKPHKNLATAVEALRLVGKEGLKLAVAGSGEGFIHGMGAELGELRSSRDLVFLGAVDDSELRRLYSGARFLVFPSLYEGFGYPPVEAMACGCPVVASDIPPLREVCAGAALYADPRSPAAFARAMGTLLSSGEERGRLARLGRERAGLYAPAAFEAGIRRLLLGGEMPGSGGPTPR